MRLVSSVVFTVELTPDEVAWLRNACLIAKKHTAFKEVHPDKYESLEKQLNRIWQSAPSDW